jgi:hypothetical protein
MAYATDSRAAKLESTCLVSGEFDDHRRSLRNFLIDVKVVQLESVIVVRGAHDQLDHSPFLTRRERGLNSYFLSVT